MCEASHREGGRALPRGLSGEQGSVGLPKRPAGGLCGAPVSCGGGHCQSASNPFHLSTEMPANAKEDRSCLQKVPQITVSTGNSSASLPKSSTAFEQVSSAQLSFEHCPGSSDAHLEVLLNAHSPLGRVSEIALLKMGGEESHFEGMMEGFSGKAADELLTSQEILQTPLSPMETQLSPSPADGSGLQMSFTESPWETMEWLDLTPPSSATGFGSLTPAGPSIFNIDFLDVTDLNLNTSMDLHLQQW